MRPRWYSPLNVSLDGYGGDFYVASTTLYQRERTCMRICMGLNRCTTMQETSEPTSQTFFAPAWRRGQVPRCAFIVHGFLCITHQQEYCVRSRFQLLFWLFFFNLREHFHYDNRHLKTQTMEVRGVGYHPSRIPSRIGILLVKSDTLRINVNIDGTSVSPRSHTHPSHSQPSLLLTSSISLGVSVPLTTLFMWDVQIIFFEKNISMVFGRYLLAFFLMPVAGRRDRWSG